MIGVRRFLGGGQRSQSPPILSPTSTEPIPAVPPLQPTAPLSVATGSKPTWPPSPLLRSSPGSNSRPDNGSSSTIGGGSTSYPNVFRTTNGSRSSSFESDSRPVSAASSIASSSRKPVQPAPPASPPQTNGASTGPSSPSRPLPNRVAQLSQKLLDKNWKRSSSMVDTRDELLMSLLASEAIVDCRECEILSSEEVEELKKESQILEVRLSAISKKLQLETKIRDAAGSLAKINATHKSVSKQSSEQLEAANRKVETVQKELWRISERSNDVKRKLMEHRSGVLSLSLRNLEAKVAGDTDEGYSSSFRGSQMSPTASETSNTSSRAKFEGPHLFAGHENAIQPASPRKLPSAGELQQLEEKLKNVSEQLQSTTKSRNEACRELAHVKLEKDQVETSLGLEIQTLEERCERLKRDRGNVQMLESQLRQVTAERDELSMEQQLKQREFDTLVRRLELLEEKSGEALGVEMRVLELESALGTLQSLMRSQGVEVPNDASVSQYIDILAEHLDSIKSRASVQMQLGNGWEDLKAGMEVELRSARSEKEKIVQELAATRKERENARTEVRILEGRLQAQAESPVDITRTLSLMNGEIPTDVKKFIQVLQPVWNALPSPETRASKFGQRTRSPVTTPGSPNMSLSELDVRLLKNLYDGRPAYQIVNNSGVFTIEEFAARVQALIIDDRALIERLIRFAQAHDLLKKNAERAQKLAQDSSVALETYQKQVKILEDRNMKMTSEVAALQDEIHELQDAIDKVMAEKREVETQAAEQAETCRQLTEANNALSAKTLTLAEEAATAPNAVRSQLEKQLTECKAELQRAKEDLDAMRSAEQSQNIALLDELNHMQGENENLRLQLRTLQAGGKK